ncbi:rust resistance kinase Lr10-like isoform X1 [Iris pallida]|uniref:Rust resistance kinase Lr10-like isoform X1 n=1 Tax=Iris pallida TaxID=29817 RepID=A0AAX6HWT7_IRIPA|nr:rust resistance kinase Lr10-like isoform X1 [Iris pallida]
MPPLFFFLILFLHTTTRSALSKPDPQQPDFFACCPPASCGSSPLKIRFPLRLRSSPSSCSPNGLDLTCRGNATFLSSFRVTAIDYRRGLVAVDIGPGSPCPLRNLSSLSFLATPYYTPAFVASVSLVSCSERLVPVPSYARVAGPVPCLSGPGYHVYAVDASESMDVLHGGDCMVVEAGVEIPYALRAEYAPSFGDMVDTFARRREVALSWDKSIPGISDKCRECEREGRLCGFDQESDQSFCQNDGHHGTPVKTIIGSTIAGLVVVVLVSALLRFVYISRISVKEKETRLKVERFLATYASTNPTRYTYSEVKKMTRNFRRKLGQGGFGSVYKGELPNGVPVAVKLLERSRGEAEEFINEVSAFGRIHHVNVVGLLGFCADGSRHALLYEFMPNGSLEKLIFSTTLPRRRFDQLQEIAVGIARGVEYLHQGCDRRILHFDIKPHNVLLDRDLRPKISDFGLAKLCARDESMVTMTAARGTMGYIAPEVYSRNFGAVSHKSDVYSFGMVLLEMVTGRRSADPAVGSQSGVYFPEWLYERLVGGEELGLGALEEREGDVAKKLVVVAFWCIQWSPTDRPSMTRVVQLLTGSSESLQIPPKPFATSPDEDGEPSINVVS